LALHQQLAYLLLEHAHVVELTCARHDAPPRDITPQREQRRVQRLRQRGLAP